MTGDLAVIGMTLVCLAHVGRDILLGRKVADRARLVNPVKQEQQAPAEPPAQPETVSEIAPRKEAA